MLEIREKINEMGKSKTPFLFLFDFEMEEIHAYPLDELPSDIIYQFSNGITCCEQKEVNKPLELSKTPIEKALNIEVNQYISTYIN